MSVMRRSQVGIYMYIPDTCTCMYVCILMDVSMHAYIDTYVCVCIFMYIGMHVGMYIAVAKVCLLLVFA